VKTMKQSGQAVFEFVVVAVLFFGIIFYIIFFLDSSVSHYSAGSQYNDLEVKAMEISEYLVHVNLSEHWPMLSYDLIKHLDTECNKNYVGILKRFDAGDKKVKLLINEGDKLLLDCDRTKTVPDIQKVGAERFALSENNTILNIRVIVW